MSLLPLPQVPAELLDLLIRDQVIAVSTAEDVKRRLQSEAIPIGKILRQKGHLTMKQLIELLQVQADRPGVRLGELACERGWCTPEQIDEALHVQRESRHHVFDLLAQDVHCDVRKLATFLVRYVKDLENRLERPAIRA